MDFRDITIDDKSIFQDVKYMCSDYIFSYLIMYKETYNHKICIDDKSIVIMSGKEKPCFYMPLGDTEHGIKKVQEYCLKEGIEPVFTKIVEDNMEIFRSLDYELEEDRDSFDYIYLNTKLENYKGKEFRNQRNNTYNFLKTSNPEYIDNIYDHIDECRDFTFLHFKDSEILKPTLAMLDNLEHFDCEGGIVRNDGNIEAFCIYEKVSDDTVVSHVELTNNSIRGAHAYMIKEMSSRIEEPYINKEDDMGLPGLRRFKSTYNPSHLIKKYKALKK